MFLFVLLLLIGLPLIELRLMFGLAGRIGLLPAVALVVGTGLAGLAIAKRQGMRAADDVRLQLNEGKMPAARLAEGAMLLVSAVMLIVPGIVTDVAGGLLLIPAVRRMAVLWAFTRLRDRGTIHIVREAPPTESSDATPAGRDTPRDIVERSLQQNP